MAIRPSARNRERIARLIGRAETHFRRVEGGYTPAERWLIGSPGAPSVFAKIGTSKQTANALRAEYRVYSKLSGPFMPELLGWEDDPAAPILLIEGLGDARWPPPWDDGLVSRVVEALDALHHSEAELAPLDHAHPEPSPGWREVAEDPQPFLSLGLASPGWLAGALPELVAAEEALDPSGEAPVHLDVRSDNLCLTDRGVILIDWNIGLSRQPRTRSGLLAAKPRSRGRSETRSDAAQFARSGRSGWRLLRRARRAPGPALRAPGAHRSAATTPHGASLGCTCSRASEPGMTACGLAYEPQSGPRDGGSPRHLTERPGSDVVPEASLYVRYPQAAGAFYRT